MKGYSIPPDFSWIENCKGSFSRNFGHLSSIAQNERKFWFFNQFQRFLSNLKIWHSTYWFQKLRMDITGMFFCQNTSVSRIPVLTTFDAWRTFYSAYFNTFFKAKIALRMKLDFIKLEWIPIRCFLVKTK